jgi:hypothetical protein
LPAAAHTMGAGSTHPLCEVSDMTTVTLTTGAQIAVPYPPPMTLDTDNPSVLAISLDRNGATIKATSAGTAWVNIGLAGDLKISLQVTVQDPTSATAAAAKPGQPPHGR